MLPKTLTDSILTIGPAPDMKGGIAQVLNTYFSDIFSSPKFIAETVNGGVIRRVSASAIALIRLVYTLATDRQIKIVHLHTATKVSFPRSSIYARIARVMGRRTIMHVHGANFDDYYQRHKGSVRSSLSKSDRVIALSDTWRKFLTQEVQLDNVRVVPNIVSRPETVIKPKEGVIEASFLGLIGERKGVFDLLEALHTIHAEIAGRFKLHIGGNGEVERLQNEIKRLGLEDIVEFHGWVRDAQKDDLLSRSRIYILPSYGEGLPISILEAMAYGNAIISTPIGGIPEVVDSKNGALIAPGDIKGLASTILQMVDNPEKTEVMGKASLERVAPYYSEAVEQKLHDLYDETLSVRPS